MRVLIAYASQFGSTREIAERLRFRLSSGHLTAETVDLADPYAALGDLSGYDAFVVGSAVHGGHWLGPAADFVRANAAILSRWPVWLFSSGPVGDRAASAAQPEPHEVKEFASQLGIRGHRVFGGAFDRTTADFSELSLIERVVVQRFLPEGDWRNWFDIDRMAVDIAAELEELAVPA